MAKQRGLHYQKMDSVIMIESGCTKSKEPTTIPNFFLFLNIAFDEKIFIFC